MPTSSSWPETWAWARAASPPSASDFRTAPSSTSRETNEIGGTRVVANQRGYPDDAVEGFDPGLVLAVGN